jgi:hypothetical protein
VDAWEASGLSADRASSEASKLPRVASLAEPSRWKWSIATGLSIGFLVVAAAELWWGISLYHWGDTPGIDLDIYLDASRRVLGGAPWHLAPEVAGPFEVQMGDVLYPITSIVLFAPWLVLPRVLWWALPIVLTVAMVIAWRPRPWSWPLMAMCIAWPMTLARTITGNPSLWMMAFLAVGLSFGWATALIALKPPLLPFALLGARSRAWWLVVGLLAGVSIVFFNDLIQYPTVIANARNGLGMLYSVIDVPMILIPGVAWFAATREIRLPARRPRRFDKTQASPG